MTLLSRWRLRLRAVWWNDLRPLVCTVWPHALERRADGTGVVRCRRCGAVWLPPRR